DPISTPAATAASPTARAVVATDAISHGARPVTRTPSRSGPAGTRYATAQDRAGSTVTPARTAARMRGHAAAARRSARGSMVTAVANTRMISSALIPWRAASQASGRWTARPITAAASTAASSGYAPSTARARRNMNVILPGRPPSAHRRARPEVKVATTSIPNGIVLRLSGQRLVVLPRAGPGRLTVLAVSAVP